MAKGQSTMKDMHQVRARLTELIRSLEQIEAVVNVATAALEHQNADRDEDVARVLQRNVGDRISAEIEKTAALLASLPRAPAVPARK
jgi:Spy/CpxP family protein refolding chaperone